MFTPDELQLIGDAKEVRIETRSGERTYRAVIWVVVEDGVVFVRSVRGEAGRWYQRALADPEVVIEVDGARIPARALPAGDERSVSAATEAFRRKYRRSPSLPSMIRPEVLGTTMRLEPRS